MQGVCTCSFLHYCGSLVGCGSVIYLHLIYSTAYMNYTDLNVSEGKLIFVTTCLCFYASSLTKDKQMQFLSVSFTNSFFFALYN